jgi:hypothetical protein
MFTALTAWHRTGERLEIRSIRIQKYQVPGTLSVFIFGDNRTERKTGKDVFVIYFFERLKIMYICCTFIVNTI